jgi:2-polyprenyl-3-methyl-5-hydroxy-6-metoxy-1,4-benzoquinol methylase
MLPVGRFLDVQQIDVDVACTDDQLQAMFDRVGAAWKAYGATEPHWSVLTAEEYQQRNLAENIDRFYQSGADHIESCFNFIRRLGCSTSFQKALDFGCGVGRLTLALAPHARQVIGVDVSPPHLNLATQRATEQSISNVQFTSIASVNDLDYFRGFDFVISVIVLQHNPPPVMAAIYRKLLEALAPGGFAIVQMPTFIHNRKFSTEQYLANEQPQLEMNALPQSFIFEIINNANCRVCEVREDSATGSNSMLSHTFVVRKA